VICPDGGLITLGETMERKIVKMKISGDKLFNPTARRMK
jgi:hypothetical protein